MPPPPDEPHRLGTAEFEALYLRLERPLFNAVFRWVWDRAEARDVVQEAFVRLWDRRREIDPATAEPLAWRVALNLAAHRRRRARLWGLLGLEAVSGRGDARPPADEQLAERQREQAVRRAIDGLPEKLKRVVLMCEYSGMGYAEIARALQIPEGTVASRRNAALKKLGEDLGSTREAR